MSTVLSASLSRCSSPSLSRSSSVSIAAHEGWVSKKGNFEKDSDELSPLVPSSVSSQTRRITLVFLIASTSITLANIAVGAFPILVPSEVITKGYRLAWIGILFLVYGIVVFAFEIFQFKIVPLLGVKKTFVLTTTLLGCCHICFGLLGLAESQYVFGIVGCLLRSIEAFSYAGVMNSAMTWLCLIAPDKAILTIGMVETLVGFGFALGPLISGALYAAVDFTLPYAIYGIALILTGIWGQLSLHKPNHALETPDFGLLRLLYTDLAFIASALVVFSMGVIVGCVESTVEVYLQKFGKGTVIEGTIFFSAWTAAAISSPLWGWVLKKTKLDLTLLLAGSFIEAVLFIFFGPFPGLEGLAPMLGVSIFCLLAICIVTSMSLMAAIDIMLRLAEAKGLPSNVVSYAFISAIWLSMLYIGEGIGGIILSTVLDSTMYYPYVAVTAFLLEIALGTIAAVLVFVWWRDGGREQISQ